jgi:peptidoglycan LD-endopeptidase CwlK
MSAGANLNTPTVSRALELLAPKFREAVGNALADCEARGLDAYVYEAYRSPELQAVYYARGRTIIPPTRPVTNASSNLYSWHGYCLAVDVIHRTHHWDAGEQWFADVAEIFRKFNCAWGGRWKMRDLPHFQWRLCKPSPSDAARQLIRSRGLEAVWEVVQAK